MFVVIDSNIWIETLGLKSSLGSATLFYLKQNNATLAIPEVVKLESERKLRNELNNYISTIEKSHRQLLSIFGTLKEVVLPDENDIESIANQLFNNLGVEIKSIPFSLESAKSSFFKTIDKVQPSDKKQQFKDGVIWQDCISLLDEGDVCLVTADKAFYKNYNFEDGLADNLINETKSFKHKLEIHSSLISLIQSIKKDVAIEPADLLNSFLASNNESVSKCLERAGFEIECLSDSVISSYATEVPSILHINFELLLSCKPTLDDGRKDGRLILTGDGKLELNVGQYCNLRNFGEEFTYIAADGTSKEIKNQTIFAETFVLGHKEVKHSVRHKLS